MNTIQKFTRLAAFLVFMILLSCKGDEPSAKDIFIKNISKGWKPSATGVKLDGEFVNGVFDTFSLTFAKGLTYSTTDGQDPVWKASGKFTVNKASNAVGFLIVRDDGVEVTVTELTESKLVIQFPFTKKGGRSSSVSGGYVFDLIPK